MSPGFKGTKSKSMKEEKGQAQGGTWESKRIGGFPEVIMIKQRKKMVKSCPKGRILLEETTV